MIDVQLVQRVHSLIRAQGLSLAVAESLTCGTLQAAIGAVGGASTFFHGGLTAYTLRQKVKYLGVDADHAQSCDCVSPQVAQEMASGTREMFGVDVGVSTTGYASPTADGRQYAWYAVNLLGQTRFACYEAQEPQDRVNMQHSVAGAALTLLAEMLEQRRSPAPPAESL